MTLSRIALFIFLTNGREIEEEMPKYFFYSYNFEVKKVLEEVIKEEYLCYSNYEENMTFYTNKDLKEILKENKLSQNGNKKDLIERLIENVDKDILIKKFSKSHYVLTEKGKKLLESKNYIKDYHNLYQKVLGINLKIVEQKMELLNCDIYKAFEEILKEKIIIEKKENNWDIIKSLYRKLGILYKENYNFKEAFNSLLKCFYLEFTGMQNGCYNEEIYFYESLSKELLELKLNLEYEIEDIKKGFFPLVETLNVPIQRFTNKEIFNFFILSMEEKYREIEEIIKIDNPTIIILESKNKINIYDEIKNVKKENKKNELFLNKTINFLKNLF